MRIEATYIPYAIAIGIGATLLTDLWNRALSMCTWRELPAPGSRLAQGKPRKRIYAYGVMCIIDR
jgi:hypothetical protein